MASDGPAWRRLGSDPPSLGSYGAAGSAFAGELRRGRLRLRWGATARQAPPSLGATARQAPPTLSLWSAGPAFVAVRLGSSFAHYGWQAGANCQPRMG